ncbi:MAG: hypothetical protein WDO69_30030 [Pseudomonadota bacterium]
MNHDDEKQLRVLGRLHYVAALFAGVIPVMDAVYAAFGVAILLGQLPGRVAAPGEAVGWLRWGWGCSSCWSASPPSASTSLTGQAAAPRQ